jgi:hypothetical protein
MIDDGIHVAEVEVQSFGSEKWEDFAHACRRAGVRFELTIVDRYGTRSQPFAWGRVDHVEAMSAADLIERIEADLRALKTRLGSIWARVPEVHDPTETT